MKCKLCLKWNQFFVWKCPLRCVCGWLWQWSYFQSQLGSLWPAQHHSTVKSKQQHCSIIVCRNFLRYFSRSVADIMYTSLMIHSMLELCLHMFVIWLDIHCVPKKWSHFYFLNNSVKNEPILIIFGTLNPEGTWH